MEMDKEEKLVVVTPEGDWGVLYIDGVEKYQGKVVSNTLKLDGVSELLDLSGFKVETIEIGDNDRFPKKLSDLKGDRIEIADIDLSSRTISKKWLGEGNEDLLHEMMKDIDRLVEISLNGQDAMEFWEE